jgi:hypothetical protein
MIDPLNLHNHIFSTAENAIEDKVNEIISEVNNIEAKLQSASPTNTEYKFANAHAALCKDEYACTEGYTVGERGSFIKGFNAARLIS